MVPRVLFAGKLVGVDGDKRARDGGMVLLLLLLLCRLLVLHCNTSHASHSATPRVCCH